MSNPFFYGGPVSGNNFFDRDKELAEIISRIKNQRSSTIISGEPRCGKTSILMRLRDSDFTSSMLGTSWENIYFSYLNAQTLSTETEYFEFWERALSPLKNEIVEKDPYSEIAKLYRACKRNDFKTEYLEKFFLGLKNRSSLFVLLLDEFDVIFGIPNLHTSYFYGGLRHLDIITDSGLVIIIASRHLTDDLEKITSGLLSGDSSGSPFFNTFNTIILKPFDEKNSIEFLKLAGDRFSIAEKRQLLYLTGGHPYLLQVAAYETWQSIEDYGLTEHNQKKAEYWQRLLFETGRTFQAIWQNWSAYKKLAFLYVALGDIPNQINAPKFRNREIFKFRNSLSPELKYLHMQGYIQTDNASKTGWRVTSQLFLWWFSDELARISRNEVVIGDLLRDNKIDGFFSAKEKESIKVYISELLDVLKEGAVTLIKNQLGNQG